MTSSASGRVAQVVAELRRYVLAHPHAGDTVEGVTRWWLSATLAHTALPEEVEDALGRLGAVGLIERRELPDGSILYVASAP